MNFLLTTLLFLMSFTFAHADVSPDEALCGSKPTESEEAAIKDKRQALERNMPPISNQNSAGWCFAFASTDVLNYYDMINHKEGTKFYSSSKNMISPFEVDYSYEYFMSNNNSRIAIDLSGGGDSAAAFLGIQNRKYKLRSAATIPFNSLEDADPEAIKQVHNLIDQYPPFEEKDGEYYYDVYGKKCSETTYNSIKGQLNDLRTINNSLFQTATEQKLMKNHDHIYDYNAVANIKGPPDITIAPFMVKNYESVNPTDFLKNIGDIINGQPQMPVISAICAKDIDIKDREGKYPDDCGNHSMTVVGAYYDKGVCSVRLRNTWGAGWGDKGYLTVTAEQFLFLQDQYKDKNKVKYNFKTILPDNNTPMPKSIANTTANKIDMDIDEKRFVGYAERSSKETNLLSGLLYKNGELSELLAYQLNDGTNFTGSVKGTEKSFDFTTGTFKDENGNYVKAVNTPLENGLYFSGKIKSGDKPGSFKTVSGFSSDANGNMLEAKHLELKDGTFFDGSVLKTGQPSSGVVRDSNDKRVKAINFPITFKGLLFGTTNCNFTGEVQDEGDGFKPTTGQCKEQDGKMHVIKDGRVDPLF